MGRPVFPYELADPDFCWLITNFQDRFPHLFAVETDSLPVVFIGSVEDAPPRREIVAEGVGMELPEGE